jgi:hypothetical protein
MEIEEIKQIDPTEIEIEIAIERGIETKIEIETEKNGPRRRRSHQELPTLRDQLRASALPLQ